MEFVYQESKSLRVQQLAENLGKGSIESEVNSRTTLVHPGPGQTGKKGYQNSHRGLAQGNAVFRKDYPSQVLQDKVSGDRTGCLFGRKNRHFGYRLFNYPRIDVGEEN